MNIGVYGILIIFGAFVLLLITNPRLSCFGKRLKSPFYPIARRKRMAAEQDRLRRERQKKIKTEDYGFALEDPGSAPRPAVRPSVPEEAKKKADDYDFKLD